MATVGFIRPMRNNIGGEIKLWRRRLGLTQEEVSTRLEVSRERYAKWERGEVMPPLEYRIKMSELGLAGIPGVPAQPGQPSIPGLTPEVLRILIETLYAEGAAPDIRASARRELYRALKLPE